MLVWNASDVGIEADGQNHTHFEKSCLVLGAGDAAWMGAPHPVHWSLVCRAGNPIMGSLPETTRYKLSGKLFAHMRLSDGIWNGRHNKKALCNHTGLV